MFELVIDHNGSNNENQWYCKLAYGQYTAKTPFFARTQTPFFHGSHWAGFWQSEGGKNPGDKTDEQAETNESQINIEVVFQIKIQVFIDPKIQKSSFEKQ